MPEPNRSPTTFMPAISGPSMTCSGRSAAERAPPRCRPSMNSVMPLTSACSSRFSTGQSRQARSRSRASRPAGALEALGEVQQPLGARPARRLSTTSSQASRSSGSIDVVDRELAGVDDAHVHAGLDGVVEEDRVHRLAHRLVAAEREARGSRRRPRRGRAAASSMIRRVASMKSTP